MSKRINQIIEVIKYVKDNWDGRSAIREVRIRADKSIAKKYKIDEKTISDKYRRQLTDKSGNVLGTPDFDRLLENWIKLSDSELKDIILKHSRGKIDQQLVIDLFKNGEELTPAIEKNYWIFQANPEYYDLEGSLKSLKEQNWLVIQHKDKIRKGDTVYIWKSGQNSGV